ncbi:hypothetical protein LOC08_08910 [Lactobacillus delbrueckii subsp. lactis]|uniref:hypothetical protein n=1 Tax=Lactobacillus delbrueckii TaxID=1584 RepID=UPI001E4860AB|nr:hypothetical protein [Lactobacillus delbrueckii]MCD5507323.1 hypothetical protein [Lactobacillus delbrueckii subsp. lactis]MCD5524405.1 hypothetical protein [Lactobacillus delbrueckii subsp. lactis]MCD5526304.1 hypothetical protein [Lactobacillus delbrueckii subsp. lactis]
MTAFTGVDSQNLPDVMVSVQFILAIGDQFNFTRSFKNSLELSPENYRKIYKNK